MTRAARRDPGSGGELAQHAAAVLRRRHCGAAAARTARPAATSPGRAVATYCWWRCSVRSVPLSPRRWRSASCRARRRPTTCPSHWPCSSSRSGRSPRSSGWSRSARAFIPGLSALDSQAQILAYALILGFAQQSFTGMLDRQAQSLLTSLPATDATAAGRAAATGRCAVARGPPVVDAAPSIVDPEAVSGIPDAAPRVHGAGRRSRRRHSCRRPGRAPHT